MSIREGVDAGMALLQDRALVNELDYQFAIDCLKDYAAPRAKLGRLIASGALIRLKKGLYLLGPRFRHTPYCLELLANLIYGPSYVSLEKALQLYGLIPEHVETVTSVTSREGKEFRTAVGNFLYAHCHPKSYSIGVTFRSFSEHEQALIATPEKALTDLLTIRKGKVTSLHQMGQLLLEDLRIEEEDLRNLDLKRIQEIEKIFPHSAVHFLEKWLAHL
jgi:hypothetical protein